MKKTLSFLDELRPRRGALRRTATKLGYFIIFYFVLMAFLILALSAIGIASIVLPLALIPICFYLAIRIAAAKQAVDATSDSYSRED